MSAVLRITPQLLCMWLVTASLLVCDVSDARAQQPSSDGETLDAAGDDALDGDGDEAGDDALDGDGDEAGDDALDGDGDAELPDPPETSLYQPTLQPPVVETICQGNRIRRIDVAGAKRVDADDVRATMKLGPGDVCIDADITRDVRALWDLGFFDDILVTAKPASSQDIVLRVEVKERPAIGKIVFSGNDGVDDDDIEEKIKLKEGEILSVPEVKRQITIIADLYAEEGYFLANIRYELKKLDDDNKQVEVRFIIDEGPEVSIRSVRFSGNRKIPTSELQGIMQSRETGFFSFLSSNNKFNRNAFDDDVTRIQAYYYDKGYLNMQLGAPHVAMTPDRRNIDISISVQEGPRYRVGKVVVEEVNAEGKKITPIGGAKNLREQIDVDTGDWFSRSAFAKGVQEINLQYKDHGYARVSTDPVTELREGKRIVDVRVRIRRGPKVRIERINIRGNDKTRDKVIRRETMIAEGDTYNQSLIERSRARIESLGYFESVTLAEETGSTEKDMVLNFEVIERSTGQFQIGAGFSSIESVLLNAQVQQENFLGRGYTVGLQLQLSGIRRLFQFNFIEPYLFDSRWSLGVQVFRNVLQFQDFVQQSTGGNLTVGHPIVDDRLRFTLRYHVEDVGISTQTNSAFGIGAGQGFGAFQRVPLSNLYQDGFISSLRLGLSWDDRDNRLFPTNGIFLSASSEVADKFLGSENVFTRQTFIARFYKKLFGGLVLKFNNEWGLITSREEEGVPRFVRYYLGGIFNIRGYRFNSIGPRGGLSRTFDPNSNVNPEGVVLGGNLQMFYNLELEFPIIEAAGIRGVIFTDGGNAWNLERGGLCQAPEISLSDKFTDPCSIDIWRVRTSWGFGVRWVSPLGPLRFEWGVPIARRSYEEPIRFEFTIGNFF